MNKVLVLVAAWGLCGAIDATAQEEFIKPPQRSPEVTTPVPVVGDSATEDLLLPPKGSSDLRGSLALKASSALRGFSRIEGIRVAEAPGGVRVEIDGRDLPKPGLTRLAKPLRIQMVFAKTRLTAARSIRGQGLLRKVRSAEHKAKTPPHRDTWVVLDLLEATEPEVIKTDSGWVLFLPGGTRGISPTKSSLSPKAQPVATPQKLWLGYRIVDIEIKEVDTEMRIILTADGKITYRAAAQEKPPKVILDFLGGEFDLPQQDMDAQLGAVGLIEARQIRSGKNALARLTINLTEIVPHRVNRQSANQLVISVAAPDVVERTIPRHLNIDHEISLDAQNQDLEGLVRTLIDEAGGELIVSAKSTGMNTTVTQKLRDVPLWKALDSLLIPQGLHFSVEGDVIDVGPVDEIKKRKIALMAKTWQTKTILMEGMPVAQAINMLTGQQFLSETNVARLLPDERRNAIIVQGLSSDILEIEQLILTLGLEEWDKALHIERIRIIGGTVGEATTKIIPLLSPGNKLSGGGNFLILDDPRGEVIVKALPQHIEEFKEVGRKLGYISGSGAGVPGESEYETRVLAINWKNASELVPFLKPHMSVPNPGATGPGAKIQIDSSLNRLIITDFPASLDRVEALIQELDTPKKQVIIEAKLVEFSEGGLLSMGVSWSGTGPSLFGVPTTGSVDLPSSSTAGLLSFGVLQSNISLTTTLSALETEDRAEVLSSPRIATQDGVPGRISSSRTVVFEESSIIANPNSPPIVTTTFIQLPLPVVLEVTPKINDVGYVEMIIKANVTSQAGPKPAQGPPPTTVQEASTIVTVKDGDTVVIGGLIREEETVSIRKVPLLSAIPILGPWLFQNKRTEKRKVELVIFLTPHIMDNIKLGQAD